ncbi:hypothetical protein FOZ61_009406 [Perkinsus olseni]|uniref:Uncharacterized protein n=1 Tax=Perkinsus olseni TaxID=32597 RepID=A0A7J6L6R9_PEROL|nr:hypothetical protein FOZ61_009406 [Perkinsus olseni]KAF4654861.1 hypothetical protein FOL46_008491 [Perkinsus olseni]
MVGVHLLAGLLWVTSVGTSAAGGSAGGERLHESSPLDNLRTTSRRASKRRSSSLEADPNLRGASLDGNYVRHPPDETMVTLSVVTANDGEKHATITSLANGIHPLTFTSRLVPSADHATCFRLVPAEGTYASSLRFCPDESGIFDVIGENVNYKLVRYTRKRPRPG